MLGEDTCDIACLELAAWTDRQTDWSWTGALSGSGKKKKMAITSTAEGEMKANRGLVSQFLATFSPVCFRFKGNPASIFLESDTFHPRLTR